MYRSVLIRLQLKITAPCLVFAYSRSLITVMRIWKRGNLITLFLLLFQSSMTVMRFWRRGNLITLITFRLVQSLIAYCLLYYSFYSTHFVLPAILDGVSGRLFVCFQTLQIDRKIYTTDTELSFLQGRSPPAFRPCRLIGRYIQLILSCPLFRVSRHLLPDFAGW